MAKHFDSLDDTFDITPVEEVKPVKKSKPLIISDKEEDKERDYQYARANLYDIVEKITDLQKKVKDLEKEETKVQQTNTQNNIFMGSTAELMKMLKEQKDK